MSLIGGDTQTEWDSSKATLQRVDAVLRLCGEASLLKQYASWYRYLQLLKREIIVKMRHVTPKGKCTISKENKFFCPLCYTDHLFKNLNVEMSLYNSGKATPLLLAKLDERLDKAETFLRVFADAKGMLLRDAKTGMEKFTGA